MCKTTWVTNDFEDPESLFTMLQMFKNTKLKKKKREKAQGYRETLSQKAKIK